MTHNRLNCAECDQLFADYFEGELDAATTADLEAHTASCVRCQGLIRDIDGIRDEAAALPVLAPSKDLWAGIEQRIQPEVVSLGARRPAAVGMSYRMLAVAAAALVVISSSVTYVATKSGKKPVRVVDAPAYVPTPGATDETGRKPVIDAQEPAPEPQSETATGTPSGSTRRSTEPARTSTPVRSQAAPRGGTQQVAAGPRTTLATAKTTVSASERAIAPEISRLQELLRQRRNQLDPATVRVVEDNLKVIDNAVKQARAALLRDPASGFLNEQLDEVLQKKVELLRTVAMLPSST